MKNTIAIYSRQITERGKKGFFSRKCQSDINRNVTEAFARRKLETMNKGLRVPYELSFYDLSKKKDRAALLEAMAENLRRPPSLRVAKLEAMADEALNSL